MEARFHSKAAGPFANYMTLHLVKHGSGLEFEASMGGNDVFTKGT